MPMCPRAVCTAHSCDSQKCHVFNPMCVPEEEVSKTRRAAAKKSVMPLTPGTSLPPGGLPPGEVRALAFIDVREATSMKATGFSDIDVASQTRRSGGIMCGRAPIKKRGASQQGSNENGPLTNVRDVCFQVQLWNRLPRDAGEQSRRGQEPLRPPVLGLRKTRTAVG